LLLPSLSRSRPSCLSISCWQATTRSSSAWPPPVCPRTSASKAIIVGIAAAAILRIIFALFATKLLGIIGLTLAGGILLLWVCWKLWREIRTDHEAEAAEREAEMAVAEGQDWRQDLQAGHHPDHHRRCLDVARQRAGRRRHGPRPYLGVVFGLVLSVALMGVAANFVARLLKRWPWIAYVGLAVIAWVAFKMIWDGGQEVAEFAHATGLM
jgi:predicted tellurium resistance membrane protein TerC